MQPELLIVLILAAVSVGLLVRGLAGCGAFLRGLVLLVSLVGFVAAGAFAYSRHTADDDGSPAPETYRPVAQSRDGYITSDNCRSCHPGQYQSWHRSFHRTMTQVASPQSVVGDFANQVVEARGHRYELSRRGDTFRVTMDQAQPGQELGSKPGRAEREVVLVTGSHHMQVYWLASGLSRNLEQLPIIWLVGEQRWIPRGSAFLEAPGMPVTTEFGRWNDTCLNCHTTRPQPGLQGPLEAYTEVAEFGIACEACHGPADRHVALNANPGRRYTGHLGGAGDDSVIQPARLQPDLDSQVCGQCHSLFADRSEENGRQRELHGFAYRPGGELRDSRKIIRVGDFSQAGFASREVEDFVRDHFWIDGMIRVSGREYSGLIRSPCHAGTPRMSCLSCHEMHPESGDAASLDGWSDDQLKPGMRTNQACLQCHERVGENLSAHTHHARESSGSLCYNCHMPHTTYGLLKAIRSHTISSPTVRESVSVGRPTASNLCHLDKTLAWTGTHLEKWYGQPPAELADDERAVAASVLWLLKGDAGLRALTAWSFGWTEARAASGTGWLAPHLATLLEDPYDAVRFIAWRSLRQEGPYAAIPYDFVGSPDERAVAVRQVRDAWRAGSVRAGEVTPPETLTRAGGQLDEAAVARLLELRDNREVFLNE